MALLSLIIFIVTLVVGTYKQGQLPDCISNIYYSIGYWFTVLFGTSIFVILPHVINVTPENIKFAGFLFCASLLFVAFAPQYRDKFEGNIHSISAVVSAIFAIVWTILVCPISLVCLVIGPIGQLLYKRCTTLWYELSCFVMIYISLLFII